jgi:hypothetical protein
MSKYVFISCAPEDGLDEAKEIANQLAQGSPTITSWLAELNLKDSDDVIEAVSSAIKGSSCFLLVLTAAAVAQGSRAGIEWRQALRYKMPIIVASYGDFALAPHLARRPNIKIDRKAPGTFEALRTAILGVGTLEGELARNKDYLEDAKDERIYVRPEKRQRIDDEIADLERQVQSISAFLADPAGARERLNQRIERGVERERIPRNAPEPGGNVINVAPVAVPGYFQDRFVETKIKCAQTCEPRS